MTQNFRIESDSFGEIKVPADAYYAAQKVIRGLIAQGNHLLSRAKSNAVAYFPPEVSDIRKRGRRSR